MYLNNLDSEKIKALNIKSTNGVLIAKVIENGPAAKAGMQANDVVVAVNGKHVNSAGAFIGELAAKKIGETVELSIIRNSQTLKIRVPLEEVPKILRQQ